MDAGHKIRTPGEAGKCRFKFPQNCLLRLVAAVTYMASLAMALLHPMVSTR